MLGEISFGELILIMLAVLLVFGSKRIPEIARGLGHGMRELKKAARGISSELRAADDPAQRTTKDRSAASPSGTPQAGKTDSNSSDLHA